MATVVNIQTEAPVGAKYIIVVVVEIIHFPSPHFTAAPWSHASFSTHDPAISKFKGKIYKDKP